MTEKDDAKEETERNDVILHLAIWNLHFSRNYVRVVYIPSIKKKQRVDYSIDIQITLFAKLRDCVSSGQVTIGSKNLRERNENRSPRV